ncbi:DUF4135 domain-containing protein [Streptococcus gallolyticus subsp. gallolyticus]|uniref:DUF4135 domain-containing protein n=1 Tax=Streptococcus gallolyticus TaxID=315405 RepID=UPI00200156DC|nr:DUF4135 domain-containing protein [Streptococcus gallolyticus]MCY7156203.1 DUF4135 domain-containing protein [Streptococcus gallolyticus subsp. gallolyticus]MCY7174704.1 DUF4135 domain-containing protein [Streptococcus gallolyticus subsp. gallolyticus]MCY7176692.1 DUF4135 domain-containing protein [Streptococcus gallolyticus subsp. gallolyticus]MCY7181637.1 DUF4135 domain-containing protein [Streptococcus gallolyticus subsp. gallolyticus]MCY7198869.1 DUF4135 domain-containing protein [Strep
MANLEALKRISSREDIEFLYEQFGTKISLELEKNDILNDQIKIWKIFKDSKIYSEISFYEAMLTFFCSKLTLQLHSNEIFANINDISNDIKKSILENLYLLSTSIFKTEIKFSKMDEATFFKTLATDFEFYNALTKKYKVWLVVLYNFLEEETRFIARFLNNLEKDYSQIMNKFFKVESKIEHIKLSMGDRHRGQSVIQIESEKGSFFYKPRSAKIDAVFAEILKKLADNNHSILSMFTVEFIDCEAYSWYKGVYYKKIESENSDEIKNYYIRLGQLLCIIYILNGGDLHYENIISYGEYPIIIDTEPLLTSRLRFKKSSGSKYLQNNIINYTEDSVRNSLILPNVFSMKNQYFEFSPFKIFDGKNPNTPEDLKKELCHSVQKDDLLKVSKFMKVGFKAVYAEVYQKKSYYINFFEQLLKGLRVRFLNKPTDDYAKVMNLLKNPVCFNNFKYAYAVSSRILNFHTDKVYLEEIAEQREILNWNIPYFEVEVNGKNLITIDGVIKDYFIETPFETLKHKVEKLCEDDLYRQLKIMDEMFFIVSNDFAVNELYTVRLPKVRNKKRYQEAKELMRQVNDIMNSSTINPLNNHFHWIGPELEGNVELGEFYYRSVDYPNSYYTGSVGILRGILDLDEILESDEYVTKIVKDIKDDIAQIIELQDEKINLGAYNGISQYIRIYIQLYRMKKVEKTELETQVLKLLALISYGVKDDTKLDILDGTAGVIKTLIELYSLEINKNLNKKIERVLKKCREHLINSIQCGEDGVYFPFEQSNKKFFTGYAHGSSGIITSLYLVGKILNYDDTMLIQSLLDTERKFYDSSKKGWFKDNSRSEYCWGWCHGIPGILLSRVELLLEGYRDDLIAGEIKSLYEILLEKSFGTNLTFCHGDLGNAVICRYVEEKMGYQNTVLDNYLSNLKPYLLNAKKYCIRGSEAPGLMHGLMGIIVFTHMMNRGKLSSMIDILKITS